MIQIREATEDDVAAISEVHAGVITRDDLNTLVRQRPDIGVVLYRNLAENFGSKLKRLDGEHRDV